MYVAALEIELYLATCGSLKAKRALIRPVIESARRRFGVSASEVAHHDLWQRAGIGFSVVSSTPSHAESLLDQVERFVWSHPDVVVVSTRRHWLDIEH